MKTVYVDHVEYTDGMGAEEFHGYISTEHTEAWLVWVWPSETIRIPAHRIKQVITTEE